MGKNRSSVFERALCYSSVSATAKAIIYIFTWINYLSLKTGDRAIR